MKRSARFYLFVISTLVLVAYGLLAVVLEREAIQFYEDSFNEQQSLQVKLSAQGLTEYFTRSQNEFSFIASYLLPELQSGQSALNLLEEFRNTETEQFSEVLIFGFFITPELSVITELEENLRNQTASQALEDWAAEYWQETRDVNDVAVTPIQATPGYQFLGLFAPVYIEEEYAGTFGAVVDLSPVLERYVASARSGQYGAAWLLDENGVVIYDHEREIIGRNVRDLHDGRPDVQRIDERILSEDAGQGEYNFTVERGGAVARKLVAWNTVYVGGHRLSVALSAPDTEITVALQVYRQQTWLTGGLLFLVMLLAGASYSLSFSRQLRRTVSTRTTEWQQAERVQAVLFRITRATGETDSLEELLRTIHEQLGTLMDTTNFYVALYDETSGLYSFPYWVDQYDHDYGPQQLDGSVTDYVRTSGEPQLMNQEVLERLVAEGKARQVGVPAPIWLGVPLKAQASRRVIGVVVVQSYIDSTRYSAQDLELLTFVSEHIAWAIERKRAEEALRKLNVQLEQRQAALHILHEVGVDISEQLNMEELTHRIIERAVTLLDADGGVLCLYDENIDRLVVLEGFGSGDFYVGRTIKPSEGFTGKAFQRGKTMIVNDYATWEGRSELYADDPLSAVMAVPLLWRDETLGTLNLVADNQRRTFDERDARLAEMFATQATVAITNARLFDAEHRQREIADTLRYIGLALTGTLHLDETLDHVVVASKIIFPQAISGTVQLLDRQTQTAQTAAASHGVPQQPHQIAFRSRLGIAGHAISERRVINVADVNADPRFVIGASAPEFSSLLVAPLLSGDQIWGTLSITAEGIGAFGLEDERLAEMLAGQAAVAIENAYLYEAERRQREIADTLRDIGLVLTGALSQEDILERILEQVARVLPYDAAAVWLMGDNGAYHTAVAVGYERFGIGDSPDFSWVDHETISFRQIRETHQVLIIPDVRQHDDWVTVDEYEWLRSWAGAPIISEGKMIGVFALDHTQPGFYGPQHKVVLEALATQVSVAVRNARLFEDIRRQREIADTLRDIGLVLTGALSQEDILERILEQVARALPYDAAAVWLKDHDGAYHSAIHVGYEQFGLDNPPSTFAWVAEETPAFLEIQKTHEILIIPDVGQYDGWVETDGYEWIRSWAGAPIISKGEMIGIFALDHTQTGFYSPQHTSVLEALAAQVAVAVRNARLFEDIRRQREIADTLRDIGLVLTGVLSQEDVLARILEQVARVLPYDAASVWLAGEDGLYRNVIGVGYDQFGFSQPLFDHTLPPDHFPSWHYIQQTHQALIIPDVRQYPDWVEIETSSWVYSCASAPIVVRGKVIGIFTLDHTQPDFYTLTHEPILNALATQISIAVENARLFEQVQIYADNLQAEVNAQTAEIRHQQERIETILRNIGDAVVIADLRGVITYANDAFQQLLGWDAQDVVGQHTKFLEHEMTGQETQRLFIKAVREKQPWRGETFWRHRDGHAVEVEIASVPYGEEGGQVVGFIASLRNISSERVLERMKVQFMTLIRDQFRTPIQTLKLQTHLLRRKGDDPANREAYLDIVDIETERINMLVKKIENATRLANTDIFASGTPLNYHTLLDNLRVHFSDQADQKAVTFNLISPRQDLPGVYVDEQQLINACYELIENALIHTLPEGQVTVRLSENRQRSTQHWVILAVEDTGAGISPEDLFELNTPFIRVGEQRAGTSAGMGVGVFIARTVAERHGGRLVIESEPGVGSTFAIWLPVKDAPPLSA